MLQKRNLKPKKLIIYTLIGLIILIPLGMIAWRYRPYAFKGLVMQSAERAPNFTLTSSETGESVSLRDFKGEIVLLYFGYTYCPDVCPTTLSDVAKAIDMLGSGSDQVRLLFITVDPKRDSPEMLEDYAKHFHPNFIGLFPETPEETQTVATQYGIYFEKRASTSETDYLMDHTATITLIDRDSYIRVIYPFGTPPEDLAADLNYILNRW